MNIFYAFIIFLLITPINISFSIAKHNINKIITISPAGYKGFYLLGICKYVKENYNLENCIFSGASAGAWLSLYMSYKINTETRNAALKKFEKIIVDDQICDPKMTNALEIENIIKNNILSNYSSDDFDLEKIHIGCTSFTKFNSIIYSNFNSLEDAIDCCISSSHIPFITGNVLKFYKNELILDGGFSGKNAFLKETNVPTFHICPTTFIKKNFIKRIFSFTTLFSKSRFDLREEIKKGYEDAKQNKQYFDSFFY